MGAGASTDTTSSTVRWSRCCASSASRRRSAAGATFSPTAGRSDELRERILEGIFGRRDRTCVPTLTLDEADWRAARELLGSKYGTWAWNYGQNPACSVQRVRRFPVGEIDVRLDSQQGRIAGLRIFGDFMGRADVREIEARLCGLAYERDVVAGALSAVNPTDYFGDVGREDVLNILCP